MTRLTVISFSCGFDSAIMLIVAIVEMLPIPMLPIPISDSNLFLCCYHAGGENARQFLGLVQQVRKLRLFHIARLANQLEPYPRFRQLLH